jgi:menaquinone-dependent protoporphyrinogen oxidase
MTRRRFLALSAGAVGAALLPAAGAGSDRGAVFPESTCRPGEPGAQRVLVAYASRYGSTGGVAEAMGQALCSPGTSVDVRLVDHVTDLSPYRAVVVGSAIQRGQWLPEAVDFVKRHEVLLGQRPTAYFLTCMTLREDTPARRTEVRAYLDPVFREAPRIRPFSLGLFSGALDFSQLSLLYRIILKAKGGQQGDYRNWPAIKAWAQGLRPGWQEGRG